jgi:glycosyltransferase involved in cell wall biosynthesis
MLTIALLTKNSEDTVKYALNSLYRQEIPQSLTFELIVVDGYSTDSTLKVVNDGIDEMRKRFRDNFARYVIMQEKVGVGYARNLALKEARGDWVLWLDSDNILAQDYILQAIKKIKEIEHRSIAVLYPTRVVPICKKRSLIAKLILCYALQGPSRQSEKRLIKSMIRKTIEDILPYTAMQGTVCNVKVLRSIGGFEPRLTAAEDIDLFLRVINKYSMEPFNSTLYSFCKDSLSEWFKQAMTWGYGRETVRILRGVPVLSEPKGLREILEGIKDLIVQSSVMTWLFFKKAMHLCSTVEVLCMPLMYVYRRAGYIKGYLCAQGQRRKLLQLKRVSCEVND